MKDMDGLAALRFDAAALAQTPRGSQTAAIAVDWASVPPSCRLRVRLLRNGEAA
jgi:hypothetical protein